MAVCLIIWLLVGVFYLAYKQFNEDYIFTSPEGLCLRFITFLDILLKNLTREIRITSVQMWQHSDIVS